MADKLITLSNLSTFKAKYDAKVDASLALKADASTTYTKTEVDNLLSTMKNATIQVVTTLPSTGEAGVIYLVGSTAPYEMYVYESDAWIDLGSTDVDLSDYYTKTEVDTKLSAKQDTLTTAQLSAVNSGITSTKVSSYDTLLSNIGSDTTLASASDIEALF